MGCDKTLSRQKQTECDNVGLERKEKVKQDSFPVNPVTGLYPRVSVRSPSSPPLGHSWLGYIYRAESKTAHGVQECLATEAEG